MEGICRNYSRTRTPCRLSPARLPSSSTLHSKSKSRERRVGGGGGEKVEMRSCCAVLYRLPPEVQRRVNALKNLQVDFHKVPPDRVEVSPLHSPPPPHTPLTGGE